MSLFEDHVAVVTGASAGIGRAIACALAAEGASICLVGRNRRALGDAEEYMGGITSSVRSCPVDLTVDSHIQTLKADLDRNFGHVDILVHCAGIISMGSIEESSPEQFDQQYRTNVRAPYLLTRTLLPAIRSRHGQIVFMNSSAGLKAGAKVGQYSATKHALKAIADSLREEVNPDGVRVLTIYPGRTATAMQALVHEMEGRSYVPERFLQPGDIAAVVVNALSLPRSAEVTDVQIRPFIKNTQIA